MERIEARHGPGLVEQRLGRAGHPSAQGLEDRGRLHPGLLPQPEQSEGAQRVGVVGSPGVDVRGCLQLVLVLQHPPEVHVGLAPLRLQLQQRAEPNGRLSVAALLLELASLLVEQSRGRRQRVEGVGPSTGHQEYQGEDDGGGAAHAHSA